MSARRMLVAGVDEAGRGPLAGPVFAAAVVLHPRRRIRGLDDSKRIPAARRAVLAGKICDKAIAWSVAWADVAEIDSLNILQATLLAMRRAVQGLAYPPGRVRVDGCVLPLLESGCECEAVVGGDADGAAISAASILAKVHRDAAMCRWHEAWPGYGFDRHKGYATRSHLEALRRMGPCPLHRRSFAPVYSCPAAEVRL